MSEKPNQTDKQGEESRAGQGSPDGTATKPRPKKPKRRLLPQWHVVLLDDDEHTYEYVIEMMIRVCNHSPERSFELAREVDSTGRVIVLTAHKEVAELKRDQITAYGADHRIDHCHGPMRAVIEPAD